MSNMPIQVCRRASRTQTKARDYFSLQSFIKLLLIAFVFHHLLRGSGQATQGGDTRRGVCQGQSQQTIVLGMLELVENDHQRMMKEGRTLQVLPNRLCSR